MKIKKVRCCVQLYSMMHLYEEAVNNALHVDLELAKSVADRPAADRTNAGPRAAGETTSPAG